MRCVVVFFALLAVSACSEVDEKDVIIMTEENFDQHIKDNEFVLVEFYAPWCGHCKALTPEYAKAATALLEEGSAIKLGKVDSTVHTSLAEQHDVKGYPTLKFFKNGVPVEYTGGRTSAEIVNWLKKKTGPPALTVADEAAAQKFIDSKEVTVVGCFKDVESADAKAFLAAAGSMDDHPFAITSEEAVFTKLEAKDGSIVLFKNFDEKKNVFEGEVTADAIKSFVSTNALPLVVDFNQDSASKIFGGDIKSHMLCFFSKDKAHYTTYEEVTTSLAKKYKGKVLIVTVNTDEEDHGRILEFFGMSQDSVPGVRIIQLAEDMSKYKPEKDEISIEALSESLDKYLDGTLKQHLLSEDLPEDWDKKPVKVLVATKFDEVAMDVNKDVLVEFYAPWCGHCKQLEPIYEKLGEKFADSETVVIAKMDSTVNELEHTKIQSFPTLKLYKKDTNEVVDYNGERTLEGLSAFLEGSEDAAKEEEEIDEEGDVPAKEEL